MSGPLTLFPSIGATAFAQKTSGPLPRAFPKVIRWNKQRGVTKYRLQIAEDQEFSNVFYDGPVTGEQFTVTALAPGHYYWRVAPAGSQTRAFLKPVRFFVSGGVVVAGMIPSQRNTRPRSPAIQTSRVR